MNDEQLLRYSRHILLPEIGVEGQEKLRAARALVIGAGGLGSPITLYLAAAGVGTLRVIDPDTVSLSNLQRQILFGAQDIGRPKAEAAQQAAARINPDSHLIAINQRIDADNALALLRDADVILDGCDNFGTRLAVSDAATQLKIPLVSAAVGQFEGQLAVYRGWEAGAPCYRCLVGGNPGRAEGSCSEQGVVGALTGIIGTMAALEVVRAIVPFGEDASGKLLLADLLSQRFRSIRVTKDPACAACHDATVCPA